MSSFISPSQLLATLAKPNSGPAPTFVAPDWKNTSSYQWNFSIERTITQNSSFNISYIGNRSVHVIGQDAFNPSRPALGNTREFPSLGTFSVRGTFNNAIYHAMQTKYTRRLAKGLQFEANYTWSHSLDDLFGYGGQDNPGVTPQTNIRSMQYGSSGYDRRHDFHAYFYYDLPLGSNRLAKGWNIGGISRISSGLAYTVVTGTNIGDGSHVQRPNLVCSNAGTGQSPGPFRTNAEPGLFRLAHCSGCQRFPGRKSGTQYIHRTFLRQLRLQHHEEHSHLGTIQQSVPRGIFQHLQQHEFQCSELLLERSELRPDYRRGGRARVAVRPEVFVVKRENRIAGPISK